MSDIHSTAIVHPKSRIGKNVKIGPFTIVEEDTVIGDDTTLLSHAFVGKNTLIGKNNFIHMGAVIGHEPQHKSFKEGLSFLKIGDNNIFREYVTIHRATVEGGSTLIGSDNFLMANAHVGHDSHLEDHITMANAALLGGHVEVESYSMLGGGAAAHQFTRVGRYAMIGGNASIIKDVPPYMLVDSGESKIGSINIVGLRRVDFPENIKREIKNAYKILYLSNFNRIQALEKIERECTSEEVKYLVNFIKNSKRGIAPHRSKKSNSNSLD